MPTHPAAPDGYDPRSFPPFAVTVDLVVLTIHEGALSVLLVERGVEPFAGRLALPGGFVQADESIDDAARRELAEETGVELARNDVGGLQQLGTYGDPDRDPRMRVVSVAHVALVADLPPPRAGTDAAAVALVDSASALRRRLAFDHRVILRDGIEHVRRQLEHTSLATRFCAPEFTLGELREVYEAVWGTELEAANFRRKVLASHVVEAVAGSRSTPGSSGGRPAQLYRATSRTPTEIDPPFRRPHQETHV
ncbi:MAG: NUDIX hydrolase [Acidimicrobiales bacterium]